MVELPRAKHYFAEDAPAEVAVAIRSRFELNITVTVLFVQNARFVTATHVLTMLGLAQRAGEPQVPAPALAWSVATNPVVVRRLVAQLRDAGLVDVRRGAGGGVSLARLAAEVTLADVARATGTGELGLARYAPGSPSAQCRVAPHIAAAVASRASAAEAALHAELETMTLGDLVADVDDRLEVAA